MSYLFALIGIKWWCVVPTENDSIEDALMLFLSSCILSFGLYLSCFIYFNSLFFTGKLLGCFLGKCSGSIRSIARHPEFPVIASCGECMVAVLNIGHAYYYIFEVILRILNICL